MFNWYRNMNRYVKWAGWLSVFFGLIVSGYGAASILEPGLPAHRGYARYTASAVETELLDKQQKQTAALTAENEKLRARVVLAQLDVNRERRERLMEDYKKRDLELQSPEVKAAPGYEALVKERVDRVKKELDKLDESDKSLFNEQKK